MKKSFVLFLALVFVALALFVFLGHSNNSSNNIQKISDIQKTENIGKTFTVQGEVIKTLQLSAYHVSGYKIQDSTGTIDVSSEKLPKMNTTVTITGKLIQTKYFGLVLNVTN
jgi:DNA/RNA endonuclease YhcR with UshA esterase domain